MGHLPIMQRPQCREMVYFSIWASSLLYHSYSFIRGRFHSSTAPQLHRLTILMMSRNTITNPTCFPSPPFSSRAGLACSALYSGAGPAAANHQSRWCCKSVQPAIRKSMASCPSQPKAGAHSPICFTWHTRPQQSAGRVVMVTAGLCCFENTE